MMTNVVNVLPAISFFFDHTFLSLLGAHECIRMSVDTHYVDFRDNKVYMKAP